MWNGQIKCYRNNASELRDVCKASKGARKFKIRAQAQARHSLFTVECSLDSVGITSTFGKALSTRSSSPRHAFL